jgi:hypothetical protein
MFMPMYLSAWQSTPSSFIYKSVIYKDKCAGRKHRSGQRPHDAARFGVQRKEQLDVNLG